MLETYKKNAEKYFYNNKYYSLNNDGINNNSFRNDNLIINIFS